VKAYLDTVLVSSIVRRDLDEIEQAALSTLLQLRSSGRIEVVTSSVTREEIARLPREHRGPHEDILHLLELIELAPEARTDSGLMLMGVGGGLREDPDFTALKSVLPDEADARHVFQALRCDATHFVTTDRRTILGRRANLGTFPIQFVLPSEALSDTGED